MAALFGASTSTVDAIESSRALAAGSRVAIKSREEEMPRTAIDFALFDTAFISVLLSFSSPAGTHPQFLSMANQPQMRLINLRGMPLWCGR
jgi:hypothetical protein